VTAAEIAEDLRAAVEQFEEIQADLAKEISPGPIKASLAAPSPRIAVA
jgi:hypothetical protein